MEATSPVSTTTRDWSARSAGMSTTRRWGDGYWQIPAGTPFTRLPDEWRCPACDGAKEQFMVMLDDR